MAALKMSLNLHRGFDLLRRARRIPRRLVRSASLLGKSLYWGWASRQAMSDESLLDRLAGRWSGIDGFLENLAARPGGSWLLPHTSPQAAAALLPYRYPEFAMNVIAAAEAACAGEFNLLGRRATFSDGVDWQRDPLSEWRWPVRYRETLDNLVWSPNPPADPTLAWELNRHQHFSYMGIAYWLTRDERYAGAFAGHVRSWIEQNPLQLGIHWHSSMEVALRAIAWTVAFQFIRGSPHMTESFAAAFFKSLFRQTDFVRSHLQIRRSAVPNNHLVAELASLAIVGAVFPEFKDAAGWRETGVELLAGHIARQTHADGVDKEQATGYHRFVVELLCILVSLGRRGLLPRSPVLEETLEKMLDCLLFITTPAGRMAMWGDCGYVRALGLDPLEEYEDARWLLAAGAVLFHRPDWKHVAGEFRVQAFWLLGEEGLQAWERLPGKLPECSSRAFRDAGVFVIREGWDPFGDLVVFRCGPFGLGEGGKCSHAHCDLLSPILWIRGRELLVDPGTFTYAGSWRNLFRTTAAHNTMVVDGREQADPLEPFGWSRIPQGKCMEWVEGLRVTGAFQATPGARHSRLVNYLAPGSWQIDDFLEGEGSHHLAWNFQFSPGLSLRWTGAPREIIVEDDGRPFVLIRPPEDVEVKIKSGWHSRKYGQKEEAPWLEGIWQGEFKAEQIVYSWSFTYAGDPS